MKNISVGKRIALAISFLIAIIFVGASVGFLSVKYSIGQGEMISSRIKENGQFLAKSMDLARSAQVSFKTQVQEWKNILLRGSDVDAFTKHLAGFNKQIDLTIKNLTALETLFKASNVDSKMVTKGLEYHQKLAVQYREALNSFDPKRPETAAVVDRLVKGIDRPASDAFDALVAQAQQLGADVTKAEEEMFHVRMTWLLRFFVVGSAIGIGIGVLCAFLLSGSVSRQLKALAHMLEASSLHVASSVGQISAASQSLAEGASEQAASLEETSSSLEEMSSMTQRNAESAKQAKALANTTKSAAEAGSQCVQSMSQSMDRIQGSSNELRQAMGAVKESNNEVAKIIKTIDEIAFQTNILALNAAVEAARAGEAGMGFAVVADEVRNLAQKSAAAARETAEKIEAAISRTEAGVRVSEKVVDDLKAVLEQSRQVESSLKGIEQKSKEVNGLVGEIAAASAEQSQGIEQVNTSVTQMDKVTQSNAANAEESASAAEELNAQAENLKEAVNELLTMANGDRGVKNAAKQTALVARSKTPHHSQRSLSNGKGMVKKSRNGATHGAEVAPQEAGKDRGSIPMAGDFKDF